MPSSHTRAGQPTRVFHPTPRQRARVMPIAVAIAKVMATIWNGGMGPASTDSVANAPHRAIAPMPAAMAPFRSPETIFIEAAYSALGVLSRFLAGGIAPRRGVWVHDLVVMVTVP